MNKLEQLRQYSIVVADTGDIDEIKKYQPQDATTNPSLLLKVVLLPKYQEFFQKIVSDIRHLNLIPKQKAELGVTKLAVLLGKEILEHITGYISTEVDARASFDTAITVQKARLIIEEYEKLAIPRDRVLIKIAATWEGIEAAKILKQEGINCNITLLFHFIQALAAAKAGIFLISPFVGRILDWYKKNEPQKYTADNDPGVLSVKNIYEYYKQHDIKTIVMAASFRSCEQVEALAGCDRLTIAPALLDELKQDQNPLPRRLDFSPVDNKPARLGALSEAEFRWEISDSKMANEKLAEGIRNFTKDQIKIEELFLKSF